MKASILIVPLVAMAMGLSYSVCSAQPSECTGVWCLLDPESDPVCGGNVEVDWSVEFTSSPTSASAGSCSGFTIDNKYAGVKFYSNCSTSTVQAICIVYSESAILSGRYKVKTVSGNCFEICEVCP
jgi:hypothetical protein